MAAVRFHDHFSGHAQDYARYRPAYPPELYSYLSGLTDDHHLAWDCGTGNGQAALGLTSFYQRVYATDPSRTQVEHATKHPVITYAIALAERSGLAEQSVDIITVAQALHWFDLQAFYQEVKRVAKPQGVLVAWCYGLTRIERNVDTIIDQYYHDTVGSYWPPERQYIDEHYRTLPFPFPEQDAPKDFHMQLSWNLDSVCDYLATWSATRRFRSEHGFDPIAELRKELAQSWGDPKQKRNVSWPLYIQVGRIE